MNEPDHSKYDLGFIDGETLVQATDKVLASFNNAKTTANLHRNKIDPFTAIFEAGLTELTLSDWFDVEAVRQLNKTLTNAVGAFHQELIGSLPGWESTGATGGVVDLIHREAFGPRNTPVLAEVKNKYNTLNSGGQENLYDKFQNALAWPDNRGATCYLIEVIPKRASSDVAWGAHNRAPREDIRRIDAKSIYSLTTGDPEALKKLFEKVNEYLGDKFGNMNEAHKAIANDLFKRAIGN